MFRLFVYLQGFLYWKYRISNDANEFFLESIAIYLFAQKALVPRIG